MSNRRGGRILAAVLVALALAGCGDDRESPTPTSVRTAADLVAASLDPDTAWAYIAAAYPDLAAMGSAFDAYVAPRTSAPPPPPPPTTSGERAMLVGPSFAGQIIHQAALVLNPGWTVAELEAPNPWGDGDCVRVPAGYVAGPLYPAGHVYQRGRQSPACMGGSGKLVTAALARGTVVPLAVSWGGFDRLAEVNGAPSVVWWVVADHKDYPATAADIGAIYDRIQERWPGVRIVVSSVTEILDPGCGILGRGAYEASAELAAQALALPYTEPGPAFTKPLPEHLASDACHFDYDGVTAAVQGRQWLDWLAANPTT